MTSASRGRSAGLATILFPIVVLAGTREAVAADCYFTTTVVAFDTAGDTAVLHVLEECETTEHVDIALLSLTTKRVTRVIPILTEDDAKTLREKHPGISSSDLKRMLVPLRAQRWRPVEKELLSMGFHFDPSPKSIESTAIHSRFDLPGLPFYLIERCVRPEDDAEVCDLVAGNGKTEVVIESGIFAQVPLVTEMNYLARVYVAPKTRLVIAIDRWASLGRAPTRCRDRAECGLHVYQAADVLAKLSKD